MADMAAHKRTEITIETERVVIIKRQQSTRAWCQQCGCEVYVVEAEMLTGMAQPSLTAGAPATKWHCFEGPDGTPLVCLESLLESM
jgi:hypothetical protein